jgi:hypothetical protein
MSNRAPTAAVVLSELQDVHDLYSKTEKQDEKT